MSASPRFLPPSAVIAGLDFSTGAVKGLLFDLRGAVIAEARLPTDLWTADGVSELGLPQLEGQARSMIRSLAQQLRDLKRLDDWVAIGISATHHTSGRIDANHNQVRRAICWNDQTLAPHHARGLARLGGQARAMELIGGPWAARYSLSHLLKDEIHLSENDWQQTRWIASHGGLVAGFLTGRFDCVSVSAAASTGIMDLRTRTWQPQMLDALASPDHRKLATRQLPEIIDARTPIGKLSDHVATDAGLPAHVRPLVFPTNDDQQAGLVGGGAVAAGDVAVILGNSAVVNASSATLPTSGSLDAMRLNWGPYLWMRCYNNGAQFLDRVLGASPNWELLESAALVVPPGCDGVRVMPFMLPEPSRGINSPRCEWSPMELQDPAIRYRAALESLAYLIAIGVREHEAAGQAVRRVVVSGGIARSPLMVQILASVLGRTLEQLQSAEGPALGAAITAMWAAECHARTLKHDAEEYLLADAVRSMVKYRESATPRLDWQQTYRSELEQFEARLAAGH